MSLRRRPLVAALVFTALLAGGNAFAQSEPTDSDRVQNLVQPSIVYLETTYSAPIRDVNPRYRGVQFDGDPVSTGSRCTGFFVHPDGYVATAGHCVAVDAESREAIVDAAGVRALNEGQFNEGTSVDDAIGYARQYFKLAGPVTASYSVAYPTTSTTVSSDEAVGARRVGFRAFDEGDIGLLKFETSVAMPGLELAPDDADVQVGAHITAVGFPGSVDDVTDQDYNPTFAGGEIQRIGTRGGGKVTVYQHGAAVSGGMSGGPVVDEEGRVIGITSFNISGENQQFNYATPVALLREVLTDKGIESQPGPVGELYREGVEALYDGNRSTALDRFEEVLKYPGNPVLALAPSLRTRAEALPEDGFPWIWVAVAAAVIGLVVLVLVLVARRRSAPRPLPTPAYAALPASQPLLRPPDPPAPKPLVQASPPPVPAAPAPARPADATVLSDHAHGPALVALGERGDTSVRHGLEGEMVIGREGEILLSDEQVSRRHAAIRVIDGRVEIEDLGSANGTEVNGERITRPTTLSHGDTITLGDTELTVDLPPPMRRVETETVVRRPEAT